MSASSAGLPPGDILSGIPDGLRSPLLREFNKILRNFREHRWEPAELNGGKLCEIVYSILKGHTEGSFPSKPSKPRNLHDACKQLEKLPKGSFSRSVRIQIPRMLIALYEIRNNRNVGHVGGDVDPNHQDATTVVSMSQWLMAELVRIFHDVDIDKAAAAVDSLVERQIPLIWEIGGKKRVLNPGLSSKEKALAVLYAEADGMDADKLASTIEYTNVPRFKREILPDLHRRKLVEFNERSGKATISPLGKAHVEENIDLEVPTP